MGERQDDSPGATPLGASIVVRIAVTLGAALVVVVGAHVAAPGLRRDALGGASAQIGVFALGLGPAMTAFILVELAAAVVPRWAKRRHAGPGARAPLERAAAIAAAVLAVAQAWGVVAAASSVDGALLDGPFAGLVLGASLVGGVAVLVALARGVSRFGLANGFVVVALTASGQSLFEELRRPGRHGGGATLLDRAAWAAVVVTLVLPMVATWVSMAGSDRESFGGPERDGPSRATGCALPIPVSSIQPISIAAALLMVPASLAPFFGPSMGELASALGSTRAWTMAMLPITAVIAVPLAFLLHRPRVVVAVLGRLRGDAHADADPRATASAAAHLRRALVPTLLFLSTLVIAHAALVSATPARVPIGVLALMAALARDLVVSVRAHAREPALVAVWEERRPYVAAPLRAALAAHGIASTARGMGVLALGQIFMPYAPVEIFVAAPDATRARDLVRSLLLGDEARARPLSATESAAIRSTSRWSWRRRTATLAALTALAIAAFAFDVRRISPGASSISPEHATAFEIVAVDDELDPFPLSDTDLPRGVALLEERAPVGPGDNRIVRFARVMGEEGEPTTRALARARAWMETLELPAGRRFGFADVWETDARTGASARVGVRSYVLAGAPLVTAGDVDDASVAAAEDGMGVYVSVHLAPGAATRLEEATRAGVGRRVAFVIDGMIESVPVVRSAIRGGTLRVTLAGETEAAQVARARQLARGLGGR